MNKRHSKQGFFFTIMAFAILSFMLLTAQVWVRTFEQSDQRAAQRFKGEAIQLMIEGMSDKQLSEFANSSAFYATYILANYTSEEGYGLAYRAAQDPNNKETGLVETTLKELMLTGNSTPTASRPIVYSADQFDRYTIASWQSKLRSAANFMGFNASFSDPRNFIVYQSDPWSISTYFEMQMNISDLDGTMSQSKLLHANATFPINGFLDPSITRGDMAQRPVVRGEAVEKQIFKRPQYSVPADLSPRLLEDAGFEGYGWFFGPLTNQYPDTIDPSQLPLLSQFILKDAFNPKMAQYADLYGAIIITNRPGASTREETIGGCTYNVTVQTNCLNCRKSFSTTASFCPAIPSVIMNGPTDENKTTRPMIVSTADLSSLPIISRAGLPSQQVALIDNQYLTADQKGDGNHRIWDITKLRDTTICGFYVLNQAAPSFFQRMLAGPYGSGVTNTGLGIETFVIGTWAGGADDRGHDIYSRLDWEFYGQHTVTQGPVKIKGMPGCKNLDMCTPQNTNATDEGLGKFKLSLDAISRYNLQKVACNSIDSSFCG
jgi:hypothetical protein